MRIIFVSADKLGCSDLCMNAVCVGFFMDPLFTNKLEISKERVANNAMHILSIVIFIVFVVIAES